MSHFSLIKTIITRKSALIKALCNMGFKTYMIEDSEELLSLKGYRGDTREQKAHIRIKGNGWGQTCNYVGGASNDLGFEKMMNGSYAFHVSEYDLGKYNKTWQTKLLNEYSREVVKEIATEQNFFVAEEETVGNEIHIKLTTAF